MSGTAFVGVDVGQTGVRVRISGERTDRASSHGVRPIVDAGSIDELFKTLEPLLTERGPMLSIGVGLTGFPTGRSLRQHLCERFTDMTAASQVVVASDIVTSYLGTVGAGPGVAAIWGTGAVALGSDGRGHTRRVDGRGFVLGDHGSGFWIGRAGLVAALDHEDGRGGSERLAARAARLGSPEEIYAAAYGAPSTAGYVAAFALHVIELASESEPTATAILDAAANEFASTIVAAIPDAEEAVGAVQQIGITGGLSASHALMTRLSTSLEARIGAHELHLEPDAPLLGALRLAEDPTEALSFRHFATLYQEPA
jgi:N-acetylmuramic acid 6-phosphate etherase